jgi:cyclophilin family peptidyl-prolyl cis-trans isomerase/HEAT repeat protein
MRIFFIAIAIVICPSVSHSASRYEHLLAQPGQRAKLADLARIEEARAWSPQTFEIAIADPEPLIRLRCAEVLGRLADPRGIPFLADLADDENEEVLETAVFALGLIGGNEATEPINRFIKGKPRRVRLRAIEALGRTGDPKAAEILEPLRASFHAPVRTQVLRAYAVLADSTAPLQCMLALNDPDPKVIASAVYALGRLEHDRAAGEIVQFLMHVDREVRLRAVEALGRLKADFAVEFIAKLLEESDRMIMIKTAEALVRIGNEDAAKALLPLLDSEDAYLRTLALDGIAASEKDDFFDRALPLLDDSSSMVRRAAMKAAASTDRERARKPLLWPAGDETGPDGMTALEWLGHISNQEDLPLLIERLTTGSTHFAREGAALGLGRWREPKQLLEAILCSTGAISPISALLQAADGEDWVVATIAVESIAKLEVEGIAKDLMRIYTAHNDRVDSDRKLAIIEAIGSLKEAGKIADEDEADIVLFLHDACNEFDPRIGEAAARVAEHFDAKLTPQPAGEWKRGELPWPAHPLPFGEKTIVIHTERGEIEIKLFGDDAPAICTAILDLTEKEFFDGLTFHRVVPGFVIQGGCPRGDGWGDAGYYLRSQFNLHPYERGTVGVAHAGKDTPGCQIFITHLPQPHLDGRYTVIGTVIRGMEVVDTIETGDTFSVTSVE